MHVNVYEYMHLQVVITVIFTALASYNGNIKIFICNTLYIIAGTINVMSFSQNVKEM